MSTGLGIKNWDDVRNVVHLAAPALAALAVSTGWADDNLATAVATTAVAVTSPALASLNTVDGFRKWFYPLLGALAGLFVVLGYTTQEQWLAFSTIITVLLGGGVAVANTPVSNPNSDLPA